MSKQKVDSNIHASIECNASDAGIITVSYDSTAWMRVVPKQKL